MYVLGYLQGSKNGRVVTIAKPGCGIRYIQETGRTLQKHYNDIFTDFEEDLIKFKSIICKHLIKHKHGNK
jgi:hypothetical protein